MGKIYDALKRAEKEAKILKANYRPHDETDKDTTPPMNISQQGKTDEHVLKARFAKGEKERTKVHNISLIPDDTSPKKKNVRFFPFSNPLKKEKKEVRQRPQTSKSLFPIQDPHSMAAEQYRILRARILSFGKLKNMRTILVTSCLPEEGKSTVSSNLAICIANGINEHALLIDCDLRRPTIHSIFGLNRNAGLSNYLNDDISLPQTLNKTEVKKLTIIPAGTPPGNPSELLSSQKMKDLIEEVKTRYDNRYIIFDSTPVHQTPDPTFLAQHIDGIILVVKAGKTNREIIIKTVESIGREKILGVVFNMAQEPIKSYYHNNDYYYSTQ